MNVVDTWELSLMIVGSLRKYGEVFILLRPNIEDQERELWLAWVLEMSIAMSVLIGMNFSTKNVTANGMWILGIFEDQE